MKAKEFNKLLKKHKENPQEIIRMYCDNKVYLTSSQFDKVLEARDGKKLKYEKNIDNNSSSNALRRIWNNITNTVRIETLQERIRIYIDKWR